MSWSIQFSGKVSKVAKAIEEESERQTGMSKTEYDEVKDHLKKLVLTNSNIDETKEHMVKIIANGHAYSKEGTITESHLNCQIEQFFVSHP